MLYLIEWPQTKLMPKSCPIKFMSRNPKGFCRTPRLYEKMASYKSALDDSLHNH